MSDSPRPRPFGTTTPSSKQPTASHVPTPLDVVRMSSKSKG
jgi:hypothetical protein